MERSTYLTPSYSLLTCLCSTLRSSARRQLDAEDVTPKVYKFFALFEERHGEHERARVIYRHAVDAFEIDAEGGEQDDMRKDLYKAYVSFEKKYGDKEGVESLILSKQRAGESV